MHNTNCPIVETSIALYRLVILVKTNDVLRQRKNGELEFNISKSSKKKKNDARMCIYEENIVKLTKIEISKIKLM